MIDHLHEYSKSLYSIRKPNLMRKCINPSLESALFILIMFDYKKPLVVAVMIDRKYYIIISSSSSPRPSPSVTIFFPISEFSYKLIRFLLIRSSVVKSDNEIGKFSYFGMECPRRTQS